MNEAVLILGMHRSGTSCLTGCLKSYGLELGDVSTFNKNNIKGNQENKAVFKLNEAVFKYNQGDWCSPPTNTLKWTTEQSLIRDHILAEYDKQTKPWGIKDPRMVFAFDFWQDHLPKKLGLVGTFRHPLSVAHSLAARKKLCVPVNEGLQLWLAYNTRLLALQKKYSFKVINFDLPEDQYLKQVEILADDLNLNQSPVEQFFDLSLKNQSQFQLKDCPPGLLETYTQLISLSKVTQ